MAVVRFTDNSKKLIPEDKAIVLWLCLTGEKIPTPEQRKYCQKVKTVTLNWRTAPDSYISKNLPTVIPQALNDWSVDLKGRPIKPSNKWSMEFARKWGLWKGNRPSVLVHSKQMSLI